MREADALYPERRRLWRRGRKIGILLRELGDASGVSDGAVIKELKKPD